MPEFRMVRSGSAAALALCCIAVFPLRSQQAREIAAVEPGSNGALPSVARPLPAPKPSVTTTLQVSAAQQEIHPGLAPAQEIQGKEILSSAGTYGDVSRYLQAMPGVVWSSDISNDLLVRGGHPEENLYVIDGVEFDGISQLEMPGTTGGFTSMIDATAISDMEMRSDVYDASYSSRLSSLIEIHTRQLEDAEHERILSVGVQGIGGFYQRALPGGGTLLLSAHRSILNLFTNNIGIDGVPVYTNLLARADLERGSRDSFTFLSLGGADSVDITPCFADAQATEFNQTQYMGRRETASLSWKHSFNAALASDLAATYSVTRQNIEQQLQTGSFWANGTPCNETTKTSYVENVRNGEPRLNYTLRGTWRGWLFSTGISGRLQILNDSVDQPIGQLSPFSTSKTAADKTAFEGRFSTGEQAGFAQAEGSLGKRWSVMGGVRVEAFAIDGSHAVEPRVSVLYRLNQRQNLHASWNASAQLPPTLDLISYPGNRSLQPITVRQTAVGMRLWQNRWSTLDAEAYARQYRHEPVSTEYPQLMLFNMIDTLGQAIVWLPLTGSGSANSRGLEAVLRAHWQDRMHLLLSATRSQSSYRALDGVRRTGNYDTPLSINALGSIRLPWHIALNSRESFASGRVYTPFDIADSLAQDRGIYELNRINALRGPLYNRLDLEFEKNFSLRKGQLDVRGGVENVMNRGNLLGYVWMQNCPPRKATCGIPIGKVDQMGRFPTASAEYRF